MILNQEELDGIINGNWTVDCPVMSLIRACGSTESYQGTGYIEQAEGFNLRFKIISTQKTGFSFKPEPTQAGQLYAPEEFWRLVARDIHGREWTSEHILPHVLHDEGTVVTGGLQDLTSSEPFGEGEEPHAIKLWLLGDFKVTCNEPMMTTTTVGGEEVSLSGERNHGRFSLGQRDFLLRRHKSWLFLEVRDPAHSLHSFFSDRIEESLEFVLGRPARATVLLKNEGDLCFLEIRSVAPAPRDVHAKPPYPPPIKDKEGHFWRLFGLHLRYIEECTSQARCPLSRAWQYFIHSRSSAVEIRALALGVGIEAILKVFYPMKESDASPQIEKARKCICAADLDEGIKRRLLGALDGMRHMSSSDMLNQVVERGVISRDHFNAWKKIRNRAAHAEKFSVDDATVRSCNLVLTAAHCIVFDVLDYRGAYKDYGTPGLAAIDFSRHRNEPEGVGIRVKYD